MLQSKGNVAIKSETGSGKTLAYLVPIINYLAQIEPKIERNDGTFAIIICPTRELCI
jgi:ATP-dependent RNA helicase DDX31/DBP7